MNRRGRESRREIGRSLYILAQAELYGTKKTEFRTSESTLRTASTEGIEVETPRSMASRWRKKISMGAMNSSGV